MKVILVIGSLLLPLHGLAQPAVPDTASEVLPGIISTGDGFGVTFTRDGKQAFYTRAYGGRKQMEIWTVRKDKEIWGKPERLAFKEMGTDIDPVVTPDGKYVLFQKRLPRRNGTGIMFNVFRLKRGEGMSWVLDSTDIFNKVNSDSSETYVTMARNGSIYFTGRRADSYGSSDIYYSRLLQGRYDEPKNMGPTINSKASEGNPCISADDRVLFFSGPSLKEDAGDIYVSVRKKDGQWGKPVPLPDGLVNTDKTEFTPYISPDGKTLYFTRSTLRTRYLKPGDPFDERIYSVPMRKLNIPRFGL